MSIKSKLYEGVLRRQNAKQIWGLKGGEREYMLSKMENSSFGTMPKTHGRVKVFFNREKNVYRVVSAKLKKQGHVVYWHGGAYIIPISNFHWKFIFSMVEETGYEAIVPMYPRIPSKLVDLKEYNKGFMADLASKQDIGDLPLVFMGDSCGGAIAMHQAMEQRDIGKLSVEKLILISPWIDPMCVHKEFYNFSCDDPVLDIEGIKLCAKEFAGDMDPKGIELSPVFYDLSGLPQIHILTSTKDVTNGSSRYLKHRCDKLEIPIGYYEEKDMIHVYPILDFPEAKKAQKRIWEIMRKGS